MTETYREIEVKLRFLSPEAARSRLESVGATESLPRLFEDNILFDRSTDPLRGSGSALRLRRVGDRSLVTYKGPVEGQHRHKVRIEHETEVQDGDAAERILLALGYLPHWRYQKYRTEFELDGLHICLDETPLGCFVELEGAPEQIDATARQMGFADSDYITASYRELLEQEAVRCERPPWDLIFDDTDHPQ